MPFYTSHTSALHVSLSSFLLLSFFSILLYSSIFHLLVYASVPRLPFESFPRMAPSPPADKSTAILRSHNYSFITPLPCGCPYVCVRVLDAGGVGFISFLNISARQLSPCPPGLLFLPFLLLLHLLLCLLTLPLQQLLLIVLFFRCCCCDCCSCCSCYSCRCCYCCCCSYHCCCYCCGYCCYYYCCCCWCCCCCSSGCVFPITFLPPFLHVLFCSLPFKCDLRCCTYFKHSLPPSFRSPPSPQIHPCYLFFPFPLLPFLSLSATTTSFPDPSLSSPPSSVLPSQGGVGGRD